MPVHAKGLPLQALVHDFHGQPPPRKRAPATTAAKLAYLDSCSRALFKIWQERESIIACLEMRLISWGKIKELDRPTTMWSGDNVIKAVKLIEI
jgi:hypothetical protein